MDVPPCVRHPSYTVGRTANNLCNTNELELELIAAYTGTHNSNHTIGGGGIITTTNTTPTIRVADSIATHKHTANIVKHATRPAA